MPANAILSDHLVELLTLDKSNNTDGTALRHLAVGVFSPASAACAVLFIVSEEPSNSTYCMALASIEIMTTS